jgi:hypothetical protein
MAKPLAATWTTAGLVASVVVHALTFAGLALPFLFVWVMQMGAIASCFVAGHDAKKHDGTLRVLPFDAPAWATAVLFATFVYAIINFAIFLTLVEFGTPEIGGETGYYLSDHGRVIRTLTEAEYQWMRAYVTRGFSGHWIPFFGWAACQFWFPRRVRGRLPLVAA